MSPFKFGHCCFDLGNCYLHGRGVIKDVDEWFRKAADQNRAKAQYNLAFA
jgi:TPR repeat protein